ncbi:SOS response-associated peptidase [Marivirga lumbricoides]|uniref:Abasic site processing protein n=1 Tax=Marivirga lumbricoides TaxID=1046115 RepID=A0A2T4DRB9_9BACT|nr:SOS response-associated peptidase [Marivirga lumbricoides]
MCYEVTYMTKKQSVYAKHYSSNEQEKVKLEESLQQLNFTPTFHTNGFAHKNLPVITNEDPDIFQAFEWGLIPSWTKDADSAAKLANSCLNARGETIFEKPAFRKAAKSQRCLVVVDGGFEHHHYKGNTYPFHFKLKNDEPFSFAGLWEKWEHEGEFKYTCTIVTTTGNSMMTKIHNNPKASGPRMPVILPKELERIWLNSIESKADMEEIQQLIRPYDEKEMVAYPVPKLRGKEAVGNSEEALSEKQYPELDLNF